MWESRRFLSQDHSSLHRDGSSGCGGDKKSFHIWWVVYHTQFEWVMKLTQSRMAHLTPTLHLPHVIVQSGSRRVAEPSVL